MPRALAIVLDLIAVVAFAAIGRLSHAESFDSNQLARTAGPFVLAALMAWVIIVLRPAMFPGTWRQGVLVWGMALVLGMLFRAMLGGGIQVSFVIVAAIALAALLFGWRGIAHLVSRVADR